MTFTRWCLLLLAMFGVFCAAGFLTVLLLFQFGHALLGWHDNAGPEIFWGLIVGAFLSAFTGIWLHQRWSGGTKRAAR